MQFIGLLYTLAWIIFCCLYAVIYKVFLNQMKRLLVDLEQFKNISFDFNV